MSTLSKGQRRNARERRRMLGPSQFRLHLDFRTLCVMFPFRVDTQNATLNRRQQRPSRCKQRPLHEAHLTPSIPRFAGSIIHIPFSNPCPRPLVPSLPSSEQSARVHKQNGGTWRRDQGAWLPAVSHMFRCPRVILGTAADEFRAVWGGSCSSESSRSVISSAKSRFYQSQGVVESWGVRVGAQQPQGKPLSYSWAGCNELTFLTLPAPPDFKRSHHAGF